MNDVRTVDPRIKLILLPLVGFMSFFVTKSWLLLLPGTLSVLLFVYSGYYFRALRCFSLLGFSVLIEYLLPFIAWSSWVFPVYMVLYFCERMILIGGFGLYISETTNVGDMLEALRRLHIPRQILVPFCVLLRFAPAMRLEIHALRETMKIRSVLGTRIERLKHPLRQMEYLLVPLLMRMLKISDELAASAMIRGIDCEDQRISLSELKFQKTDYGMTGMSILLIVLVVLIQIR